jgi:hypothetical protein
VTGAGYTGEDGLSRMPDYGDALTVRQPIDLVAYLKSLSGKHGARPRGPAHGRHDATHGKHGATPAAEAAPRSR